MDYETRFYTAHSVLYKIHLDSVHCSINNPAHQLHVFHVDQVVVSFQQVEILLLANFFGLTKVESDSMVKQKIIEVNQIKYFLQCSLCWLGK